MAETEWPNQDFQVEMFDGVRGADGNPVQPVRLTPDDAFCFSCHRDVPCWNVCCHGADITLSPMDILRLSRHLAIEASDFLVEYTLPAPWGATELPVAKLKMGGDEGKGPCPFVSAGGCAVYLDRPVTCRYYPLGLATVKMKGDEDKHDFHFLVKESHCQGHLEDQEQTVSGFTAEQGIEAYRDVDRGWMDILMKTASWASLGGPFGRDIPPSTRKMFFMVSTDAGKFRRFVFATKFLDTYEIDAPAIEAIETDDEALLMLGFDWLKSVMFNEPALVMKEAVLQSAIAGARTDLGAG